MMTKYLEKRLVLEDTEKWGMEFPIELEYYLIESEINYRDDLAGKKVYGIAISKKISESCFEEKIISNFSCSIKMTKKVIEMLAGNYVTPIGLQPVLEDFLSI